MSLGDVVSDAVNWISNEVRKTFEDPFEPTFVVTTTVSLDSLSSWQETPVSLSEDFDNSGELSKPVVCEREPNWRLTGPKSQTNKSHQNSFGAYKIQNALLYGEEDFNAAMYADTKTTYSKQGEFSEDETIAQLQTPFPMDCPINQKVYLFQGDICTLKVDAIMSFSNETLDCRDGLAGKLLAIGGYDLLEEIETQTSCRSGEARITHAYHMPARYILHTVGPRYNTKYMTAAQNTLNGCYRECLKLLVENNLRTLAVQCVQSDRKNFPLDELCHTALRSVRRWVERLRDKVDAIVFVAEKPKEFDFYYELLRLYFPRSVKEERLSFMGLPDVVGNEFGEIEVEERKIRIGILGSRGAVATSMSDPSTKTLSCASTSPDNHVESTRSSSFGKALSLVRHDTNENDLEDEKILDASDLSFTEARTDIDSEKRVNALSQYHIPGDLTDDGDVVYFRYVREAHAMSGCPEFKKIARYRFVYPASCDKASRPLIVFCAANFPAKAFDWHILLLYIISTMDPYIRDRYTLLFVNAGVTMSANNPGILLLKEVLSIYQWKLESTLDQLHVLFPGVLFRAAFSCCWPFLSNHVWNTTRFYESIRELDEHVETRKLNLPQYVYDYDKQLQIFPSKSILNITL